LVARLYINKETKLRSKWMFFTKEERLRELALQGDHLAEYYLGRYYLEEINSVDDGIYWLLKSRYGDPRYASVILNKLSSKYETKIKKIARDLNKKQLST
jgi:hypothetical protein